jgi:hypothetical protein
MAQVHLPLAPQRGFGETSRRDLWWLQPLAVAVGLITFLGYGSWAGMQGDHYWYQGYLSPLYSPELWGKSPHAIFGGPTPPWWPSFLQGTLLAYSPAMLILIAPAGFRVTCYYYRGAYYKAFWLQPAACAVGKPHKTYTGERAFPLIIQNIHRYFMYVAVLYLFILAHDTYQGMWFKNAAGAEEFGIGVGTIVLALNVTFLSLYTAGCHSFRHVIGGFKDILSRAPVRQKLYSCSTWCNERHQRWAWTSLFWVMFTDLYVRLVSMGIWTDWRII